MPILALLALSLVMIVDTRASPVIQRHIRHGYVGQNVNITCGRCTSEPHCDNPLLEYTSLNTSQPFVVCSLKMINGNKLNPFYQRIQLHNPDTDGFYYFTIGSLQINDSGQFRCTLDNGFASLVVSTSLEVREPELNPTTESSSSKSINIVLAASITAVVVVATVVIILVTCILRRRQYNISGSSQNHNSSAADDHHL